MSPTLCPPISRPVYPQTPMAAAPRTQQPHPRHQKALQADGGGMARAKMKSGGKSADCTTWCAPCGMYR